ncbi:MAG: ThuA domain-containing protein [Candidatus Anammoximicrobium sp.]|nr:ThuA domain-containing protein [Candidatus Anammoximicrobium sp.]
MAALGIWILLAVCAWAAPPYKALIVDGQNGHDWKSTTPVLKKLLEETKLFAVDVATSPPKGEDMSGFKPDFAAYAVVVSNYQGDLWPAATQKAFVEYVKNGGGFVVFHFACAAFPQWKEYNEIIGIGGWGGRNKESGPLVRWRDGRAVLELEGKGPPIYAPAPKDTDIRKKRITGYADRAGSHGPMQPFQIVIRDPKHPITKGLPEKMMHVDDELYGWLRGPAKNLTVLATSFAPEELGGSDEDEPVLFTVGYGQGRVVQVAPGHTAKELQSVAFIVLFQRAAEWAATGKVTLPAPADLPTADKASVRQ